MKKVRKPLAWGLFVLMMVSFFPALTAPVLAADPVIRSLYIERTDNETLETVSGVIEINGSGLQDVVVNVFTTGGGGGKILGTQIGKRVNNFDGYVKFELTGPEMRSIIFDDGVYVGGIKVVADDGDFATVNNVEPKVVYMGDQFSITGSNLAEQTAGLYRDVLTFGNGTLNGTVSRLDTAITVSNVSGDPGMHDLIFTRTNTGVANVTEQVRIRRLYQNQIRMVQLMNVPDLEMYPNKGVPGRTTVFFQADNLDKASVFFQRNSSDPLYTSNMGTDHEYIPDPSGKDIIKVKVPDITPGTYQVYLTNFMTNPPAGKDLRNNITRQQLAGEFIVISSADAAEITSVSPSQGPNLSSNAVTVVGYNLDELYVDNLTITNPNRIIDTSPDQKILQINYGTGTYNPGGGVKAVTIIRTLRVIIGKDTEFQDVSQQAFQDKGYDTLHVITQPIADSEVANDPSKDVVVDITTTLQVSPTEKYEFRELAIKENGFLYIKSYNEPQASEVTPEKIHVIREMGNYVTKEDMVISISGSSFMVSKYKPVGGDEQLYYPIVDLGGSIILKREGKNKNNIQIRNPATGVWSSINGASMEVLNNSTIIDGSAGKESGNRIVLRIPDGLPVLEERLNFPAYIEITNPKKSSNEHGYPVRKDDMIQFVTVEESKTPVINSVVPNVGATIGEKGIKINGYNFQADVKVYLDGVEISGIKRDPSSQLITFDAPPGREGITRLVVVNPEGGTDSADFIYVKTQTEPKITSVSPPEGTIGTLLLVNGDVFLSPDPTSSEEGIGIYRLIGARVLLGEKDVNTYYYLPNTNDIALQNYSAPAEHEILRISSGQVVLDDAWYSVLLKDEAAGKFYILKSTPQGQTILTDGITEYTLSVEGTGIRAKATDGQIYDITAGNSTVNLGATVLTLKTPYYIDPDSGLITGNRARVVDGGKRILVTVPDLGVQGLYDVTVVNPDTKRVTLKDGFKFYRSPQRVPVIKSIVPDQGSTTGGYFVEIQGENFEDTGAIKTRVFINGIEVAAADTYVNPDGQSVRIKMPDYPGDLRKETGMDSKAVPVVVVNPSDGGSTGIEKGFIYVVPTSQPVIDQLTKTGGSAAGGEYVQIIGRDFRFYEPYKDVNANFKYDEGVDILLNDLNGDGEWTDLRQFSNISELNGNDIKILPQVYFGNTPAAVLDFGNGFLGVTTPSGRAGTVQVYVVNNDYGISNSKPYIYSTSKPQITKVIPDTGRKQGGENVEIHGTGFNPTRINLLQPDGTVITEERPLLRFGTLSAVADIVGGRVPNLEVTGFLKADYDANQQSITLTLTPGPQESYRRTFIGYDGQERFINLNLLRDEQGNSYPGYELVKIQVVQDPGNRLRVDRGYATHSTLLSSEQIEVVTPTYYTVGEVALTLINPDGATAVSRFIYKNPDSRPQITNIARDGRYPQNMTIDGRQVKVVRMNYKGKSEVSVFGEDFRENARIQIGSIINLDSSKITYTLPNKLTFIMPDVAEGEVGKLHRVVVMNEDGGTASSDEPVSGLDSDNIYLQFTRGETKPQITAVYPSMGPVSGGTRVKIEGLDFRASIDGYEGEKLSVKFGGQEASSIQVVDYKTVYALTPVNSPGNLSVRVENPDGEITDPVGSFTYISSPLVTAAVDAADPTENTRITVISVEGNQEIKLKGSGFMEGCKVVFMPVTVPAAENSSNVIYRVKSKTEDNYTSQVLDAYILQSGVEVAAKLIDPETLTLTAPAGKLDMKGLIVVNPDKGASPPFEDIMFGLPEIDAPSGKVWAEILYDSYYHTDRAIKVVWNPVTGATQYEIYVVEEDRVNFVGSTHLTAWLLQDIKPYTRYKFIIKAIGNFGSSGPSAESNQVKTGRKTGIPDPDGKPGEKTVMQKLGNSAWITIGSKDFSSRPIVIDLTRDALAGATEAVVHLPANMISSSRPPEIEVRGRDFNLRFNPAVFNTSRVSENRNREDAGVKFSISPYKGNPGTASGNILSPVYQLNALFYKGKEQSDFSYLGGKLSLILDYDQQKAEWRRLNQVKIQRYDQASGQWVDIDPGTAGLPAGAGAINRTGLYSVMGSRR